MADPNPDVAGGGCEYLAGMGVETLSGVLDRECRSLNQPFIKYVTTGLPYVRLKAAATLDGFIAGSAGDSKWITNERSRQFGHRLRSVSDAVLVGIGTALADDPLLTARLAGKGAYRQPVRIVLDTTLKIPLVSRLVRSAGASPLWIACAVSAPAEKESALREAGVAVIRIPAADPGLDLAQLLKELGKRRISSVLVEGGGQVLGSFMESGLADEFYFFYAPKILGDRSGVGMVSGRPRKKITDAVPAFCIKTRNIAGDVLVSGSFRKELY
jgi:diaminohydroxyphosphoribosylaminopyrimidine deaminase/5-amino-6-(5-phosphoribosylamino)uracil reductase